MHSSAKIFVFISIFASLALALSEKEIRSRVDEALRSRHPTENEKWFRDLGSEAPPVLMQMYRETDHTYHRIRLIEGLRAFRDNAQVGEFLRSELAKNKEPAERRSLAQNLAVHSGAASIDALEPLLNDEDPQMRLLVAQSLKSMSAPETKRIVDEYQRREKVKWIVDNLEGRTQKLKPLEIVSSSAASFPIKMKGIWKGHFIKAKKRGLTSSVGNLSFKEEAGKVKMGELVWFLGQSKRTLNIQINSVQADGAQGQYHDGTRNYALQVSINESVTPPQIIMQVPEDGALFIGQREAEIQ